MVAFHCINAGINDLASLISDFITLLDGNPTCLETTISRLRFQNSCVVKPLNLPIRPGR